VRIVVLLIAFGLTWAGLYVAVVGFGGMVEYFAWLPDAVQRRLNVGMGVAVGAMLLAAGWWNSRKKPAAGEQ
jgi:hypothetical protein